MRAQLEEQLNEILETRDSARGLIVSMSDVLFDTGQYSLKPGAREKLAKVAGILIAYPSLNIAVGGYTDNVGGDEMNQKLSENRAGSVRDYLVQEGVVANSVSATGFGNTSPVASNDNSAGRQAEPESGTGRIGRSNWKPGQRNDWKPAVTPSSVLCGPQGRRGYGQNGWSANGPDQEKSMLTNYFAAKRAMRLGRTGPWSATAAGATKPARESTNAPRSMGNRIRGRSSSIIPAIVVPMIPSSGARPGRMLPDSEQE